MKLFKTLALFLILILLAAYVYFFEIEGGKKREKAKELQEKLFNFEPDSVVSIEISSWNNLFRFTRVNNEEWRIVKPVETDADKSPISSLLTSLQNMKKEREFNVNKDELLDYGLYPKGKVPGWSSLKVTLTFNNHNQDSLKFGNDSPIGSSVFANKVDTIVYMVPKYIKNNADKTLFDWRDKSVAKVKKSDIRECILKNDHGTFTLVKEGSDWQIKSPVELQADNSTVSTVLNKMEYGKAKSIVSETMDDPKKYKLDKPAYQLNLYLGEAKALKKIQFSVLKENEAYGKDESRTYVFTVDSSFIRDINKSLFDLRHKKIAEFEKDDACKLMIYQGDSTVIMEKDTSGIWTFNRKKIKEWKINSFLNSLSGMSAKKFLAEHVSASNKYGLKQPKRKIQVYKDGDDEICSVSFGEEYDDKRIVVLSTHSKIIAEVDKSVFNNLEFKPDDFIELEKLEENKED
jgi:hypothetical protein